MSKTQDNDDDLHGEGIDTSIPRRQPEFVLGTILLTSFVALTVLQVFTRYIINDPLQWTEELASHLLIWLVFVGAVGVHREDGHLRVEMLDEWAPKKFVAGVRLCYDVIILVVLILLVKSGWDLYESMRFDKLPALRWPLRYFMVIAPIASALMAVYTVKHMINRIRVLQGKDDV